MPDPRPPFASTARGTIERGLDEKLPPMHSRHGAIEEATLASSVREFFKRYEASFNRALNGEIDTNELATLYATEFIAATPAGVMAGKNDDQLMRVMEQGYARYREMGTREMRIRNVRMSLIDEHHCLAHVAWTATYARKGQPDLAIEFDVHYLVQTLDIGPKIFGWISGDEQALLRKYGII